jgi:hypothetical protein
VQPLVVFEGDNSTRLAALALPALALVAAWQFRDVELPLATVLLASVAILAASFHARYSDMGVPDSADWAALEVIASVCIVIAVGWPRIRSRGAPDDSLAPFGVA